MSVRFSLVKWLAVATLIVGLAFTAAPGRADANPPLKISESSTCLSCHENLYYLYDTGKWFCVAKAPMMCVNCHGGDPTAVDQTAAHQHLETHPVINGDTTTCRQCHVNDCAERVQQFDRIAGINENIKIALATQPQAAAAPQPIVQSSASKSEPMTVLWVFGGVGMLAVVLGGLWRLGLRRTSRRGE